MNTKTATTKPRNSANWTAPLASIKVTPGTARPGRPKANTSNTEAWIK